jgi:hypothetical protein
MVELLRLGVTPYLLMFHLVNTNEFVFRTPLLHLKNGLLFYRLADLTNVFDALKTKGFDGAKHPESVPYMGLRERHCSNSTAQASAASRALWGDHPSPRLIKKWCK